ncbi:hypothetical protein [Paraflavitalea speifideaquila]|uniref:hypothetical protein n=1 Tax=Paraflavitalea speifideaquila TaxID=3076558 RepID=UPI0028F0D277|nr:hypothetical protein [Paraflavitalea speifideiaquila]
MQIIIFGFALTNEVKNSKIAILDNAQDIASKAIRSELDASRYFDVVADLHSYEEIEAAFKRERSNWPLYFPNSSIPTCNILIPHRSNWWPMPPIPMWAPPSPTMLQP